MPVLWIEIHEWNFQNLVSIRVNFTCGNTKQAERNIAKLLVDTKAERIWSVLFLNAVLDFQSQLTRDDFSKNVR